MGIENARWKILLQSPMDTHIAGFVPETDKGEKPKPTKDMALSSPTGCTPHVRGCSMASCILLLCWKLLILCERDDSHTNSRAWELLTIPWQSLVKTRRGESS